MSVLSPERRKELEQACVRGRRAAEAASRAAIGALGVLDERPPPHLSEEERDLRGALRAKRDQLGDERGQIELLVTECAYEQWHRLLFARFLAENNLLIHPEFEVQVTLAECDELAADLGEPDAWAVAGRFAAEILPGIFRVDDPCVRLRLAPEGRLALEQIVESISAYTFEADDALGWVYQHWQRERKDEVNAAERKIGGADLAPVTQLFTENYMVRFLLENSLGAWWASRHPDSPLVRDWEYLRFDDGGKPAAGTFQDWPAVVAKVTVVDPCSGSGHFLVEAFGMLWQMRAEEEGLATVAAQDAVLRDNLFGLELDPRCVQIAMFAVAMAAWKSGGGWRDLPVPNVACSGITVKSRIEDWQKLGHGDIRLISALSHLHTLFGDADSLGSLIDPSHAGVLGSHGDPQYSIDAVDWQVVGPLVQSALSNEVADDPAAAVFGQDAVGLARAAELLSRRFTLAATNPPFLGRPKAGAVIMEHTERHHPEARHDLATVMLARWQRSSRATAFVTPQGWLFQPRWTTFRESLLRSRRIACVAWLGEHAFESDAAAGAFCSLQVLESRGPRALDAFFGVDCDAASDPTSKALALRASGTTLINQARQLENPDARILIDSSPLPTLGQVAESFQGIKTCDNPRFAFAHWELPALQGGWIAVQSAPDMTAQFHGRSEIVFWEDGHGAITTVCQKGSTFRGDSAWGRAGVVVAEMRSLHATIYSGEVFDGTGTVVVPRSPNDAAPIWLFVSSDEFSEAVRSIDRKLSVATSTLEKVPVDIERWRAEALQRYPDGLPDPHSNDPTQWLFDGRPDTADHPLQVAVARLLGYRWPRQADVDDLDPLADDDGLVCLPSVLGERTAPDRLQDLLARAFGGTWSPARAAELLAAAGSKKTDLDSWLRDEFFRGHCQIFKNRPFIWHIWDGRRDGFNALVNYHRLDRPTLERLAYTYLGDWIERQAAGAREDVVGAEQRLVAARELQRKLELILVGDPPNDIYVRWKPHAEQAIGWAPDLNDGVRLNVRPFVQADVLRARFNVKWEKDRGKNPNGSERLNDLHLTNAEKRAARGPRASA